jgi:hypothetical protein
VFGLRNNNKAFNTTFRERNEISFERLKYLDLSMSVKFFWGKASAKRVKFDYFSMFMASYFPVHATFPHF